MIFIGCQSKRELFYIINVCRAYIEILNNEAPMYLTLLIHSVWGSRQDRFTFITEEKYEYDQSNVWMACV